MAFIGELLALFLFKRILTRGRPVVLKQHIIANRINERAQPVRFANLLPAGAQGDKHARESFLRRTSSIAWGE